MHKEGSVQCSSVQLLSRVRLFATPRATARQASLSITNSRSSLRLTSIESVMPSLELIYLLVCVLKLYTDFLNLFLIFILYWIIVDLQCVSFRCTYKVIQLYIYLFFFKLFSHLGCCIILSRVPCTIQQLLVSYQF